MAYYFAVETEEDNYLAKSIRNSRKFGRVQGVRNEKYICTMNEIDSFTSQFEDEETLKNYLIKEGIMVEEDTDKNIAIIYVNQAEIRVASKNIIYKNSENLVMEPIKVIKYIETKIKNNDLDFLNLLVSYQPITKLAKDLLINQITEIENNLANNNNTLNNELLSKIIKELLYVNRNSNISLDEEKLHHMIVFINEYEELLNKTKNKNHTKIRKI